MSNPIENLVDATNGATIQIGHTRAAALATFAAYGAFAAGRDGSRKVRQIIRNRKAAKATPEQDQTPQPHEA